MCVCVYIHVFEQAFLRTVGARETKLGGMDKHSTQKGSGALSLEGSIQSGGGGLR